MAKFGKERFQYGVFYLATMGRDTYPRVHPFTPFIGSGHLFAFMYTSSPKGKDLLANPKYAMHSLVGDMNGGNGEFQIKGEAIQILANDPRMQMAVDACPYPISKVKPVILFEFMITKCFTNYYTNEKPNFKHWKEAEKDKTI
jgi:Pyridoxamine 5'-phosphate oxidase